MTTLRHWLPAKVSIAPLLFVILAARDAAFGFGA